MRERRSGEVVRVHRNEIIQWAEDGNCVVYARNGGPWSKVRDPMWLPDQEDKVVKAAYVAYMDAFIRGELEVLNLEVTWCVSRRTPLFNLPTNHYRIKE